MRALPVSPDAKPVVVVVYILDLQSRAAAGCDLNVCSSVLHMSRVSGVVWVTARM